VCLEDDDDDADVLEDGTDGSGDIEDDADSFDWPISGSGSSGGNSLFNSSMTNCSR